MEKGANGSLGSTPPAWLRWPGLRQGWIVIPLERNHLSAPVVVAQDRAEIGPLLRQAMGPPLAHAHAMAVALTLHQQLKTLFWPSPPQATQKARPRGDEGCWRATC